MPQKKSKEEKRAIMMLSRSTQDGGIKYVLGAGIDKSWTLYVARTPKCILDEEQMDEKKFTAWRKIQLPHY
jgi:hypothetical protein